MPSEHKTPQKLDQEVAFWQRQVETLERFRRRVIYVAPLSLLVGAILLGVTREIWLFWAALAGGAVTLGIGFYMYHVRSAEFAYHISELKQMRERP